MVLKLSFPSQERPCRRVPEGLTLTKVWTLITPNAPTEIQHQPEKQGHLHKKLCLFPELSLRPNPVLKEEKKMAGEKM